MEVTTNWSIDNNVGIHEVIQESTKFPTGDFADLLDEEKCISLSRPSTGAEECHIRLMSKPPGQTVWPKPPGQTMWPRQQSLKSKNKKLVLGVMLISEARVVEICTGSHDEYCKTVHGTLKGDFEDTQMYMCEVQFEKPKDTVMLKMKAACHVNSLWVYGFHVTTAMEPSIQTCSRFSSDHLTSVLKDKDVQMSKQAMKFRQMLENFNSVNDSGNSFIGNNPMALMSVMLGPMMSTSQSSLSNVEVDGKNEIINKKRSIRICSDNRHILQTQDASKEIMNVSELKNNQDLCANGSCLASNIEGEITCSVGNGIKNFTLCCEDRKYEENRTALGQDIVENRGKAKDLAMYTDNLVEKLYALLSDGGSTVVDQQKLSPLLDIVLKAGTSTSKSVVDSAKGYFTKSVGIADQATSTTNQAPQAVMDLAKKGNMSNKDRQLAKLISDECSDSSATQNTKSGLGPQEEECVSAEMHQAVSGEGNSSDCNETLVNCIENLIDKKFAILEKRLVQRLEQKLAEKAKEDTMKLDRIEGLLSKLCEKL